eukprot:CAMPEP_0196663614 /NCGR_PEP_ID=MMETSP1086-20130531/53539_1 /TAXON_ID=77921 /ORGANISM="Cyanoptyche  gloeocystis , Strain SAG4.97" /LENGTH=190 /DNA_ID=CAMNT_0041999503 /DNA_START=206 /DNA_END=779 /DNA_ORIENTATION=-
MSRTRARSSHVANTWQLHQTRAGEHVEWVQGQGEVGGTMKKTKKRRQEWREGDIDEQGVTTFRGRGWGLGVKWRAIHVILGGGEGVRGEGEGGLGVQGEATADQRANIWDGRMGQGVEEGEEAEEVVVGVVTDERRDWYAVVELEREPLRRVVDDEGLGQVPAEKPEILQVVAANQCRSIVEERMGKNIP